MFSRSEIPLSAQASIRPQKVGELPSTGLLSKRQLAKYLRCSVSGVDSMILDGLPYRKMRRAIRFSRPEVEAWLRSTF